MPGWSVPWKKSGDWKSRSGKAMGILIDLFSWPSGIVVGNLIASAMWATPALIHLHRKIDRNHAEHLQILADHGIIRKGKEDRKNAV
jgi:hypothetical protein